jgi:hypothetical protein
VTAVSGLFEPVEVENVPAKQELQIADAAAPGAGNKENVRWQLLSSVKDF